MREIDIFLLKSICYEALSVDPSYTVMISYYKNLDVKNIENGSLDRLLQRAMKGEQYCALVILNYLNDYEKDQF